MHEPLLENMFIGTFAWKPCGNLHHGNLGNLRKLVEPLLGNLLYNLDLGTSCTTLTWEPWQPLLGNLMGIFTWEPWESLLGNLLDLVGICTWQPVLWNLGNLSLGNLHLETFTWGRFGPRRNLYLAT